MRKSPKKPRQNAAGQEEVSSSARDGNDVLGFDIVRRPRSSRVRDAMQEIAEAFVLLQEPRGSDAIDNSDVLQEDYQKLDQSLKFDEVMMLINLMSLKQMSKSPKKPGQNATGQEEVSSSAWDGHDVLGFDIVRRPRSSRVQDAKQEIDPAEALGLLWEPCGSDAIDNSNVLQKDYQKSTSNLKEAASASFADPYGGTQKSVNEGPVVEEEELSRNHSHQALADCPEKSSVIQVELKKPKLDHEVSDNSVVMQEEKQKVYLDAPAPSNSSEEESSDIIDGEANQTA